MPISYQGIVPYLFYDDPKAAMQWYTKYFAFEEIGRWADAEGRVHNAEMRAGNAEIWLDGGGRRFFDKNGDPLDVWIGVWVDNVDAMYEVVTAAGLDVAVPVTREFGIRMLTVGDPYGYQWGFMRRV